MTQEAQEIQTISPEVEARYKDSLRRQESVNNKARRGDFTVEQLQHQISETEQESVKSFATPINELPGHVNKLVPTTEKEMLEHIATVDRAEKIQAELDAEYESLKSSL